MSDQGHSTPHQQAGLGLAGTLAKAFIHSPLSPLLLIATLALGLLGLAMTPRQEDPQISVPMVDIFVQYPGAAADQVSALAIEPLERIMSEIPGVKHVYSASQRSGGMVTIEFEVGEEMGPSLVKVNDKIQSNLDKIPPGVSQPLIKPKGVDDVPVVTLTLWSHSVDEASLRALGLDVLQRLKEVDSTAQSFIVGGRSEALRVEVFPERLAGFGITLDQIAQTIHTANAEREVGNAEAGQLSFTLRTGSFLRTARDIENLMIGGSLGQPVYIRDVALVTEATDDVSSLVNYYTGPAYGEGHGQEHVDHDNATLAPVGAPAVTIAVAKQPGSNGVTVAEEVLAYVDQLKGSLIPDNVQVEITRNYGETANEKVNELIFKLFVVTGAVTILIWLALGWRAASVVLIVIPVVILLTVFSAWLMGYTIDRVSLFALIFSIGILVDDAIVVVENVYRRWLIDGKCTAECNVDAVREVGNPTILATFTVIAALLPMGFVSGMMGPYMQPIPALGSVAMLLSLFAAFMFTPWLAQRIRPPIEKLQRSQDSEHRQAEALLNFFQRMLTPLIENRLVGWLFGLGLLFVFFLSLSMFATTSVTVKMLPNDNKPEFNVAINMPEGTPLPETANVAGALAQAVMALDEVTAVQTYVGTASPFNFNGLVRHTYLREEAWQGDIQVQLLGKEERDRSSHDLAVEARELLTPIADQMGARIEVIEMPPGPPVLQTMVAEVYGPDNETRRQVAADIEGLFHEADTIVDVDSFIQAEQTSFQFVVDREKASRLGISVEDVNRQLDMAMGGFRLGDVKSERMLEPKFIYLQMPFALRGEFGRLEQLPVPTAMGTMVPLGEIGHFESYRVDDIVYHKDLRAVEYVTGEVAGRLGAPIYAIMEVEDLLDGYTSPDGVRVASTLTGPPADSLQSGMEWTGEWTVTYETFRDMGLAFGAALILIYILVVWEFGNFTLPAIVMVPIPLTLIGIIPGHWLFNASFTATSMIGFIALAGIIVRNSILLVDFSRHAVADGMDVREAVIYACSTRTRPIIITALALIIGSSVILSDPIFQGMAISLMMGGLVSTLLTLVVIPLGCVSWRQALVNDGSPKSDDDPAGLHKEIPEKPGRLVSERSLVQRAGGLVIGLLGLIGAAFELLGTGLGHLISRLTSRSAAPAAPTAAPSPAPQPVAAAPAAAVLVDEPAAEQAKVEPAPKPAAAAPAAKAKKAPAKKPAATKPKAQSTAKPAITASAAPKATATAKAATGKKSAKAPKPAAAKKPVAKRTTTTRARRGIRLKDIDGNV